MAGQERRVALMQGLASNAALEMDMLRPLLASRDASTLVALARRPDLARSDAEALMRRGATVRTALAGNHAAAMLVWRLLVEDPEPFVRATLAGGAGWSERAALIDRPRDVPLPGEVGLRLADDPEPDVRFALAQRDENPDVVRRHLVADPSSRVRAALPAGWADAPIEAVRKLLTDAEWRVRRVAIAAYVPPPELVPALLDDPIRIVRLETLARAPIPAESFVGDPDPDVRAAVAGNPNLSPTAVMSLASDPEPRVRVRMMYRPDLPETVRERIAGTVRPEDLDGVARWLLPDAAPLSTRLAYVDSPLVFVRRAVAHSADLPLEAARRLFADEDTSVRLLAARHHPDAPAELLVELASAGWGAMGLLRFHRNFPAAVLVEYADSADGPVRMIAAAHPRLPAAAAVRLSGHIDAAVRREVAANPALPSPEIVRALEDPSLEVVKAAASNPQLPRTVAEDLIRDSFGGRAANK
ncbi:hypothetical protein K1W54_08665 [Micromonospora sp. CPCC 205371]|nr:hypothetical protein [Micromonospora sp. CPCC 205371]